ncbi:MAG TPA: purine phosphoribosyltransferase family protein [Methanosarcinaceae archaeon]|nr:purine phosphoribosyltransferase family protein [Methanosarcinaceae archaeon]
MLNLLKRSLAEAPIIKRGEYYYFIHPISDGVPILDPELIGEISDHILGIADTDIDRILTIEAMGIPIATALSLKTGIPLSIVRKRKYELDGEVELSQSTGYSNGELYINGIVKGDRVLIVDDVISTGGTLHALVKALHGIGAIICGIIVVIERGDGSSRLAESGIDVTALVKIDVNENGISIMGVSGE